MIIYDFSAIIRLNVFLLGRKVRNFSYVKEEQLWEAINSYLNNKEGAILAVFNVLADITPNQDSVELINYFASDALLVDVIRKMVEDESTYQNASVYLSPLALRILKMDNSFQRCIFKGNETISNYNFYTGEVVRQYSDAKNDFYLNKGRFGLARQIYQIKLKAEGFEHNSEAFNKAVALHNQLNENYIEYLDQKSDYQTFKSKCDRAISDAREVLETHRGWKNILLNIALHIALLSTCGVGNIIALSYAFYSSKPGQRSFFCKLANTDSGNRIKNIEQSINKLF